MKLKVLVIEDKKALNHNIVLMLRKEGFIPISAYDISYAKKEFIKENPDLVLLDIMLPGGKGYDLIPYFRRYSDVRIIMITALNDEESKEIAYLNGADDYISKPFKLKEIAFKLRVIKRRILQNSKNFKIGDITFDIETGELICNGQTTILSRNQINFLKLLYIKHDQESYLDKTEIFDTTVDESGRIHTMVNKIREELNYVGSKRVSIETVYGKGYKFDVIKCNE